MLNARTLRRWLLDQMPRSTTGVSDSDILRQHIVAVSSNIPKV